MCRFALLLPLLLPGRQCGQIGSCLADGLLHGCTPGVDEHPWKAGLEIPSGEEVRMLFRRDGTFLQPTNCAVRWPRLAPRASPDASPSSRTPSRSARAWWARKKVRALVRMAEVCSRAARFSLLAPPPARAERSSWRMVLRAAFPTISLRFPHR